MTAPLTTAALARAYNAIREAFDAASGSCGEHRCCVELDELRGAFLALPPLPVVDAPEVGSRWVRRDGTHHPRTVREVTGPMVSSMGERLEHFQSVESFLAAYVPAPEASE